MATTDGTTGSAPATDAGAAVPAGAAGAASTRRGRTAAQQRAEKQAAGSPGALAHEIEQTREQLAETLDAIADRVSPKRVARRTTQKAAATVKETAASAKVAVASGAASAKEAVAAGKDKVSGRAVDPVPDAAGQELPAAGLEQLPPVEGVAVPELGTPVPGAPTPDAPLRTISPGHVTSGPATPVRTQALTAAGVAAALAAILVVRRRRSR